MKKRGPIEFALRFAQLGFIPLVVGIYLWVGAHSAFAFFLGDALSLSSLTVARLAVTRVITPSSSKVPAISRLQFLLLVKLPIFAAVVWYVNTLGRVPLFYFVGGYLLVYFGLLVGAIFLRSAPAAYD